MLKNSLNYFCILFILLNKDVFCQNLFVNAKPETGAELLNYCLTILINKHEYKVGTTSIFIETLPTLNDKFLSGNLPYGPEVCAVLKKYNFKMIFLLRDLRNEIVEHAYYVRNNPKIFTSFFSNLPFDYLISWKMREVVELFAFYKKWLFEPNCLLIKFEELISSEKKEFLDTIKKISQFLNIDVSDNQLNSCFDYITKKGKQVNEEINWNKAFKSEHKKLFKEIAGNLLIELGYEKNVNW